MTKRNVLTFALGIVMGLALSIAPAQAGPRPSSELGLFSSLNGVQTRETNSRLFVESVEGRCVFVAWYTPDGELHRGCYGVAWMVPRGVGLA